MITSGTHSRVFISNILYATDFSNSAEAAAPYAIGLAKRYGAKVHAIHVRYPDTYPIVGPEAMPVIVQAAHEQAKLQAQQLHKMFAIVPHEVSVCNGEVWPSISDIVSKQKTDLIVIGSTGRTGISRALLGSVAEEIFRKASCPVLTVGPQVSQDPERCLEMKQILYATDYSTESLAALPWAVDLAQEHQARLTLLHVVGNAHAGELVHAEQYADSIQRQLRNLVPPEAEAWCEIKCMAEHGREAEKILQAANALGADLIVLGVRAPKAGIGVTTHLLGSVAHDIVTAARCPVLTVRG